MEGKTELEKITLQLYDNQLRYEFSKPKLLGEREYDREQIIQLFSSRGNTDDFTWGKFVDVIWTKWLMLTSLIK